MPTASTSARPRLPRRLGGRHIKTAEVREKFFNVGVEAVGSAPEYLGAKMKSDIARMGKVIKDAGIHAD